MNAVRRKMRTGCNLKSESGAVYRFLTEGAPKTALREGWKRKSRKGLAKQVTSAVFLNHIFKMIDPMCSYVSMWLNDLF